jgi:hypothetical protein
VRKRESVKTGGGPKPPELKDGVHMYLLFSSSVSVSCQSMLMKVVSSLYKLQGSSTVNLFQIKHNGYL